MCSLTLSRFPRRKTARKGVIILGIKFPNFRQHMLRFDHYKPHLDVRGIRNYTYGMNIHRIVHPTQHAYYMVAPSEELAAKHR